MSPKQLRAMLDRSGLSQAEVARRMRLGRGGNVTVSRWLTGTQNMTAAHERLFRAVCEGLEE